MDAKELRLGNYVNNEQRTDVIDGIDPYRVQCHLLSDKNRETLYEVPLKLIKPIPLTEDWLLKFGFEKALNGWWSDNELWSYKNGKFYLGAITYLSDVTFVHQLQNLYFALTNKELTIKK